MGGGIRNCVKLGAEHAPKAQRPAGRQILLGPRTLPRRYRLRYIPINGQLEMAMEVGATTLRRLPLSQNK